VQFLKSLESKDSKALKYVDLDKYIQHTCMPRTACPSFAKTAHGVFAVTCLRAAQVLVTAACGRFREFPSYR
jgi:hypothetical protein